jgi:DHA1 family bicyclomycin/chloramphenicol resistance-like MFS transporter
MNKGVLILLMGALSALGPLSVDMYLPAFPELQRDLGASSQMVSATLASFFAGLCLGQMIYGPMSDRVGRKRPLVLGISIYVTASLGCLLASSIELLVVLRFLQALGACAGMVVARAMIRDLFDPTEGAKVLSAVILAMGVAPIVAPLMGQLLSDVTGWRGIFGFMVFFSLTVLLTMSRLLPADGPVQVAPTSPLMSRMGGVLRDRNFLVYAISGTLIQAGLYAYITGAPALFIDHLGFSSKTFSMLFGLNASGLIMASQLNTWLLNRYSYRQVMERALQVAAAAAVVIALMGVTGTAGRAVLLPLFIFITTLGMVFPNSTAGALAEQGHQAGLASSTLGVIQYAGAAIASAGVGLLGHFTEVPLQLTIGLCGVLSLSVFWLLKEGEAPIIAAAA